MHAKPLKTAIDYLAYVIVRLFICVVQTTRIETCAAIARFLATMSCDVLKIRHQVVEENLKHAFPELSDKERHALAWRMWEHLFLMVVEVAHAPRKIHHTNWRDYIQLDRADEIIRALFDDRSTVILCGHYGNFELSSYALGILGFPTYTIARPLDNPYLDRYLNEFRGLHGQFILSKSGSAQQIENILARGGTIAMLADQYAGPKGCWVDFFGRPASSHKGIALFTLANLAPTIFCYTRRIGEPLQNVMGTTEVLDPRQVCSEMLTVPGITEWYTRQLERTIRRGPEQYWWVHRRWKDSRPPKRKPSESRAA